MKKVNNKFLKLCAKYREIIAYIIVGALTTIVSLASYCLLTFSLLNPNDPIQLQIANIISWVISVTFAYFTNRRYVFRSKNQAKLKEASSFYASRLGTLLLEISIMLLFVTILHFDDKIMKIIAQFIILVSNYLLSKFFVFIPDKRQQHNK